MGSPSVPAHATVLHARTGQDRARLESLRQKIAELKEPAEEVKMVRRGLAAFPNAVYQLETSAWPAAGRTQRPCASVAGGWSRSASSVSPW